MFLELNRTACTQTSLRQGVGMMGLATAQTKWSATLNALPSCSPQGHSQTTLHYARSCHATTFVFTPLARKQVCDKGIKTKRCRFATSPCFVCYVWVEDGIRTHDLRNHNPQL